MQQPTHVCEWCGIGFTPSRSDAHFHSSACKQAYWRWKHGLEYVYQEARVAIEALHHYFDHPVTHEEAASDLKELAWLILWARNEESHVVEGEPETPLL